MNHLCCECDKFTAGLFILGLGWSAGRKDQHVAGAARCGSIAASAQASGFESLHAKKHRNSLFLCETWQWDDQMHQMLRYCKDLLNPVYTEWGALEVCVSVSFLYMPFYSESDFLIVCSVSLEFFFEFLYFHLLNLGSCLLHTRCQSTTIAVLGVSRAMLCRQSCGTYQVGECSNAEETLPM